MPIPAQILIRKSVKLRKAAKSGARWAAGFSLISASLKLAQLSVLARYLSPQEFGAFALVMSMIFVGESFVKSGFSDVVIVRRNASAVQLSTLYWLNVLVGLLLFLAILAISPLLANFTEEESIGSIGKALASSFIMLSLGVQFEALMRRELQIKTLMLIKITGHVLSFLVAVILAVNGFGVWALVASPLVLYCSNLIFLSAYAILNNWLPSFKFDWDSTKGMMAMGVHRMSASVLGQICNRVDQVAIGLVLGPAALGYYSVAYNVAMQPFNKINPVLTQISFPVFARIKDDDDRLRRNFRKGQRILMAINAPILVGAYIIAPTIVPLILGDGWDSSIPVLQALCIYALLRSASGINIGLILSKEKFKWPVLWNFTQAMMIPLIILTVAWTSQSVIFVAIALTIFQGLLFMAGYFLFVRKLLGPFGVQYTSDFGKPVVCALGMAYVAWLGSTFVNQMTESSLLSFMIVSSVASYLLLSIVFQRQHLRDLSEVIKRDRRPRPT